MNGVKRFLQGGFAPIALAAAAGLLAAAADASLLTAAAGPPGDDPVAVFRSLDGRWSGTFVGYDAAGAELYRLRVQQTYKTVDANTQSVELSDTDAKGTTTTGKGRNVAKRRADGSLELTCVVDKSNGDHVEHTGRVVAGPDGDDEIVWSSQKAGRSETFRERVSGSGKEARYEIDGMARYGETLLLMAGRYRRE
jgi:hypothetical protein